MVLDYLIESIGPDGLRVPIIYDNFSLFGLLISMIVYHLANLTLNFKGCYDYDQLPDDSPKGCES